MKRGSSGRMKSNSKDTSQEATAQSRPETPSSIGKAAYTDATDTAGDTAMKGLLEEQLQSLIAIDNPKDQLAKIAVLVSKPDHESNLKSGAYVDFMFFNLHFCKEIGFSEDKICVIMQLMDEVYRHCEESRWSDLQSSFEMLKQGILTFCMSKADQRDSFTAEEVQKLTDFVTTSFFRYFRVYRFLYEEERQEIVVPRDICCEVPTFLPPLSAFTQEGKGKLMSKGTIPATSRKRHHHVEEVAPKEVPEPTEAKEDAVSDGAAE